MVQCTGYELEFRLISGVDSWVMTSLMTMAGGIGFGSFKSLRREFLQTSGDGKEPESGGDMGNTAKSRDAVESGGVVSGLLGFFS